MNDRDVTRNLEEFSDDGIAEAIVVLELFEEYPLPESFVMKNLYLAYHRYRNKVYLVNDMEQFIGLNDDGDGFEFYEIGVPELDFS